MLLHMLGVRRPSTSQFVTTPPSSRRFFLQLEGASLKSPSFCVGSFLFCLRHCFPAAPACFTEGMNVVAISGVAPNDFRRIAFGVLEGTFLTAAIGEPHTRGLAMHGQSPEAFCSRLPIYFRSLLCIVGFFSPGFGSGARGRGCNHGGRGYIVANSRTSLTPRHTCRAGLCRAIVT